MRSLTRLLAPLLALAALPVAGCSKDRAMTIAAENAAAPLKTATFALG